VVAANGNIFFGQAGSNQIAEFNSAGSSVANFTVAIGPRGTDWIDLAADQCTMHYTSEGSAIKQFNVCTNAQLADFATGLSGGACYAHRIRPNGEELVACTTNVFRVNSSGAIIQTYPSSSLSPASSFLFALNLDPDGATFWTGDLVNGNIYRVNIGTGAQVTTFNSAPFVDMAGLAVVGEIVVSQPTATPTGGVVATATPTVVVPTATRTPTLAPVTVPTLSFPMLGLLAAAVAAAALVVLMRR
jgi:hypothetical protein